VVFADLAHVDDEYTALRREAGLDVETCGRIRGAFSPPQRLLFARRSANSWPLLDPAA
jgi:hypothetical protein